MGYRDSLSQRNSSVRHCDGRQIRAIIHSSTPRDFTRQRGNLVQTVDLSQCTDIGSSVVINIPL